MPDNDLADLAQRFGHPGAVTFRMSPLGGPVVQLSSGAAEAVVALQGAHVLDWRIGETALLWCSPVARLDTGRAVRGGIPICWPWFGPHPTDAAKPQHGFARVRPWDVVASAANGGRASVTLRLATAATDLALWPHAAAAQLTVTLEHGLSLGLETHNVGATPFALTAALHTYFRVGDIGDATVLGLEGCDCLDKVEGYARRRQAGPITVAGEVDRIYLGDTSRIALADVAGRRRIEIVSRGSRSAVVWNPWAERTRELGDMGGPDAFRDMLCIETANAGDDVVRVEPGGRHMLAARYTAEDA